MAFDYLRYKLLEQTINKVHEARIRACFQDVVNGNDGFDDANSLEMGHYYWLFKHGWLCAELELENDQSL